MARPNQPPRPPPGPSPRREQPIELSGEVLLRHIGLPPVPAHDEKCARQNKEILQRLAALALKVDAIMVATIDAAELEALRVQLETDRALLAAELDKQS